MSNRKRTNGIDRTIHVTIASIDPLDIKDMDDVELLQHYKLFATGILDTSATREQQSIGWTRLHETRAEIRERRATEGRDNATLDQAVKWLNHGWGQFAKEFLDVARQTWDLKGAVSSAWKVANIRMEADLPVENILNMADRQRDRKAGYGRAHTY